MVILDIAASFLIAALAGMGVGGGGLLVLYLVMARGMEQVPAQGLNLLFFIAASGAALVLHAAGKRLQWRLAAGLALAGAVGAVCGSYAGLAADPALVRKIFGGLLIVSGGMAFFGKKE